MGAGISGGGGVSEDKKSIGQMTVSITRKVGSTKNCGYDLISDTKAKCAIQIQK